MYIASSLMVPHTKSPFQLVEMAKSGNATYGDISFVSAMVQCAPNNCSHCDNALDGLQQDLGPLEGKFMVSMRWLLRDDTDDTDADGVA